MATEAPHEGLPLHPVARAVAEARAREHGVSLSDYVSDLVLMSHRVGGAAENSPFGLWRGFASPAQPDFWRSGTAENVAPRGAPPGKLDEWGMSEASPSATVAPRTTPAVQLIAIFNDRIQGAALLLSAAFVEAAVRDFNPSTTYYRPPRGGNSTWYEQIVNASVTRSQEVKKALLHRWQPTPRAEQLALDAFVLLSELTPARSELLRLCRYDRSRAFAELAKHVELIADQFKLSAELYGEVEAGQPTRLSGEQHFAEISAGLLKKAGGGISLTEGAKLLGTTRQALHKRIKAGSALGMMMESKLVLPRMQFVPAEDGTVLVQGLADVLRLFYEANAGGWSALQFLIERDPNLGEPPIEALSRAEVEAVVNAARAYLGLDEG